MYTYSSISSRWKLVEEGKRRMTRVGNQQSKLVQLKKADSVILKVNFGHDYWNLMVRISVICSRMFEGQTLFYGCDQKRYARKKRLNIKLITKDHNQGCKKGNWYDCQAFLSPSTYGFPVTTHCNTAWQLYMNNHKRRNKISSDVIYNGSGKLLPWWQLQMRSYLDSKPEDKFIR